MCHFRTGILVLPSLAKATERISPRAPGSISMTAGYFIVSLGAEVAINPLHRRVPVGRGTLGDEVVDVLRPVLDRRVPAASVVLDHDLDDRRVQGVSAE